MDASSLEDLLVSLGHQKVRRRNSNLMSLCPSHDDSRPSWGISIDHPHMHACFTCGFKGTLRSLLRFHYKMPADKVDALVGGKEYSLDDFDAFADEGPVAKRKALDDSVLFPYKLSDRAVRYMQSRHISKDTCQRARLCYNPTDRRVLFPWYIDKEFFGATGRTISKDASEAKTIGYFGIEKGFALYLPSRRVMSKQPLVLVEGEIDALSVLEVGVSNIGALSFGTFTKEQQAMLKKWAPVEIVCFFDNDTTGRRLTRDVVSAMSTSGIPVTKVPYDKFTRKLRALDKSDPAGVPEDIRLKLIEYRVDARADWELE